MAELALNKPKPWFDEHSPTYEQLRGERLDFAGTVIGGVARFDPVVSLVSPRRKR